MTNRGGIDIDDRSAGALAHRAGSGDRRRRRPPLDPVLGEDLSWVLSTAREHARLPLLRTASGLATHGVRPAVHRSQVGRWESGGTQVTFDVVRRYERALGLPERQLSTTIELLAHQHHPQIPGPFLERPLADDWLERCRDSLERAYTDERMTGVEWDDLAFMLGAHPHILLRDTDWGHLLERCLTESMVSTGLEFLLRVEAMTRLASHPQSAAAVVAMSRRALADPSTQIFESLGLLVHCQDPRAYDVLLDALDDDGLQEPARWAAFYTLASLASLRRLEPAQRHRAGLRSLEALRDKDSSLRITRNAASFLRAVDPPTRQQLVTALKAESRARIAQILQDGGVLASSEAATLVRRIELLLVERLGPAQGWEPTIRRLVAKVTSTTHEEERGGALSVLLLTSAGRVVGTVYAAQLRASLAAGQAVLADDCLCALSWLLQPADLPDVLAMALDPTVPGTAAMQAAVAVGNARPHRAPLWDGDPLDGGAEASGAPAPLSEAAIARQVVASAREEIRTPRRDSAPIARGYCYLLGMYGRLDLLAELHQDAGQATDPGTRADWERATAWWTSLPVWARPAADPSAPSPAGQV